ncbi:hypothetical protein FIBSPDRAFT_1042574 [Athelia psychrophila]|uniref:Uncharacterized protein n=1 Tax=Athelia psychrophila TaxID=1759441 RepID=A0A166MIL0_9AGAM|nr:hypothetical protein FIBSPDRAFT_1042574 [Fibularhizoctonia sp. CBS 109695]
MLTWALAVVVRKEALLHDHHAPVPRHDKGRLCMRQLNGRILERPTIPICIGETHLSFDADEAAGETHATAGPLAGADAGVQAEAVLRKKVQVWVRLAAAKRERESERVLLADDDVAGGVGENGC